MEEEGNGKNRQVGAVAYSKQRGARAMLRGTVPVPPRPETRQGSRQRAPVRVPAACRVPRVRGKSGRSACSGTVEYGRDVEGHSVWCVWCVCVVGGGGGVGVCVWACVCVCVCVCVWAGV